MPAQLATAVRRMNGNLARATVAWKPGHLAMLSDDEGWIEWPMGEPTARNYFELLARMNRELGDPQQLP